MSDPDATGENDRGPVLSVRPLDVDTWPFGFPAFSAQRSVFYLGAMSASCRQCKEESE